MDNEDAGELPPEVEPKGFGFTMTIAIVPKIKDKN